MSILKCILSMFGASDKLEQEEPASPTQIKKECDLDAPNLFFGRFIKDRNITCEVIGADEDDFRVMILKIAWDRLGTYLDVGKTYPLRQVYQSQNGEMKIWEVIPETMKRQTSQVLLAWEKDVGWSWDLDM